MTTVVSKPYMIQPKATGNNENICIVPYKVCACLLHSKQVFVSGNNNKKSVEPKPLKYISAILPRNENKSITRENKTAVIQHFSEYIRWEQYLKSF